MDQTKLLLAYLSEYHNLLSSKLAFLRNTSHKNWIMLGDRNTSFYHRTIASNKRRLTISALKNPDGTISSESNIIQCEIHKHFLDLWCSHQTNTPHTQSIDDILHHHMLASVLELITNENNHFLCAPFLEEEILSVV